MSVHDTESNNSREIFTVPDSRLVNDGSVDSDVHKRWKYESIPIPPVTDDWQRLQLVGTTHKDKSVLGMANIHLRTRERCSPR